MNLLHRLYSALTPHRVSPAPITPRDAARALHAAKRAKRSAWVKAHCEALRRSPDWPGNKMVNL